MKMGTKKQIILVLVISIVLALLVFLAENVLGNDENIITRNTYGEGSKTEEYELYIDEIDYSMEKYLSAYHSARYALAYQDITAAKEHLDSEIEALGELEKTKNVIGIISVIPRKAITILLKLRL